MGLPALSCLGCSVSWAQSQAPVRKSGRCVGMLELFHVFRALIERKDFRDLVARRQAGDFATPARYLRAEEWVDQNFDWLADEVAGIVTPSDVLRRVRGHLSRAFRPRVPARSGEGTPAQALL